MSPAGERAAVLPDGCMDLVWTGTRLLVAGPDTTAVPADRPAGVRSAGLRFRPGALPSLLGVPASALRDRRVPLADVAPGLDAAVRPRLEDGDPALPLLAEAALRLPGHPPDRTLAAVAAQLAPGTGADVSVAGIAEALGCTTRTLHRRCHEAFGYGPAVLRRVLRFRRAVALLAGGVPPAAAAARAGYADQPHLSREVRALAGRTPAQLASAANRSTPLPSGSSTTA